MRRVLPIGVACAALLASFATSAAGTTDPAGGPAVAAVPAATPQDPPDGARTLTHAAAEARWADAASRFVELDGIRVHYKDEGRGSALLLVHGSMGDLADWDGWAAALQDRWRVIRFDRPGAGLTGPVPNGNYSLDRQLALIDALMDTLGVERFAIAGASLGGPIAYRYAGTRRDRVSALVLINSAGIEYGGKQGTTRAPPPSGYGWMTGPTVTRADLQKSLSSILNDPAKLTPAFVERKFQLHAIEGRDREGLLTVQQYERGDPARLLQHVRAPALVLWGSGNRALSTQTADAFVAALKNAAVTEKIVYDGAGHMIHVERPEQTAKDAGAFLAAHARLPATPDEPGAAHWARAAGTWVGEAGYLDGGLKPNVAEYGALLRIAYDGRAVTQTEWKFYPSSSLAKQMTSALAKATLPDGQGLALVSASRGAPVDASTLDFGAENGAWVAAGDGSSAGTVLDGNVVRYRMFYTFPSPDRMVRTTLGFAPDGTLKGVSVFRYRRVAPEAFDAERERLLRRYAVSTEIDRTGATPALRNLRR